MKKIIQLRGFIPFRNETVAAFTARLGIENTIPEVIKALEDYRTKDDSTWDYVICEEGQETKAIEILKDKRLLAPLLAGMIKSSFSNITTLHRSGVALSVEDLQGITTGQSGRLNISALNSLVSSTNLTVERQLLEYAEFALFCKGLLRVIDMETVEDNNADYALLHGDASNAPAFTRETVTSTLDAKWNELKAKEAEYIKTLGFREDTFSLVSKYLSDGTVLAAPQPEGKE